MAGRQVIAIGILPENMKKNAIRLVTWNIRWGRGMDNTVDLDRIVAHTRRFSPFDILCLQEVAAGYTDAELEYADGSDQFDALAEKLSAYTAVKGYAIDQLAPSGTRQRFGNMIFSRFPVLQIYRHRLPWPAEAGVKSMPRMALETLLDTPLGVLRVMTTHLEFYSALQRMAQVDYLREVYRESRAHARIAEPTRTDGPFLPYPETIGTVLAGDFNFAETSVERARLLSPIDADAPPLMDAWEIAHPGKKHAPTMGCFDRERWPDGPFVSDYVFVSGNLAPYVQEVRAETQSQASDHQALLLRMA